MKLSILKPSVNNMSVRVFARAAGLDIDETDVWGHTRTPEFLKKCPAHLTPMLEAEGLPMGSLWESCAIMQYLSNKHGLEAFYPSDPARRAMVDSAMFYLIGTLYPLVARATYPALGFPQYPGEVGASDAAEPKKEEAADRLSRPLPSRWRCSRPSSSATSRSSAAIRLRSPISGLPQPWSSFRRSIIRLPNGRAITSPRWKKLWGRPMPNLQRTFAAISIT
jgi:glutathione S-transferase